MLKGTAPLILLAGEKVGTQLYIYLIGFGQGDSGLTELSKNGNHFLIIKHIY